MLYHYLDHKRKESSAQLHATYLVSGKFVDNGQTVRPVVAFFVISFLFFFFLHAQSCSFNDFFYTVFAFQSHKVSVVREDQLEGV